MQLKGFTWLRRRAESIWTTESRPPFLATGGNLAAGATETMSADLQPGDYELVCHLAGHYAAGQKLPFKVE